MYDLVFYCPTHGIKVKRKRSIVKTNYIFALSLNKERETRWFNHFEQHNCLDAIHFLENYENK